MGLTDLCFIDIDHIKTEKKVDMAMSILRDDRKDVAPQIDTFFISASNVFCA